MNIKNEITELLIDAAGKLNLEDKDKIVVSFSNLPQLCDFQTNYAMLIAKKMGMKPIDVANEIVSSINTDNYEFSTAFPGFVNIKIKDKILNGYAGSVLDDKNLGVEQVEKPRLVFFDYGGANVAKELHVGHLRSPIVGEALKRLHVAMGDKTLSDVHLGDFGLQMGLTILQLKLDGFLDKFFAPNADFSKLQLENVTLDVLNEEYPKASKRKDVDEEFNRQADAMTLAIQQQ